MKTRLLLIGAELDVQEQEYIKQTRKHGIAINTSVVIAAASGIIKSHDANQLAKNGGGIKLTDAWTKNIWDVSSVGLQYSQD